MNREHPSIVSPALLALCLLAFVSRPVSLWGQKPTGFDQWEPEIKAFEATDKTNPPPAHASLFIGSSSIRLWKTLARDFPGHKVINRGFGGSQIIDSVHFIDRIVFPYAPDKIFLYAGGNDINGGKTPEQVFADFKAFAEKVQARLPETRLAYISIAPNPARWAQVEKVRTANKLIEDYCGQKTNLTYINVFAHMLGDDGQPRPEIFVADRLHMNAKGYELWTRVIKPYFER